MFKANHSIWRGNSHTLFPLQMKVLVVKLSTSHLNMINRYICLFYLSGPLLNGRRDNPVPVRNGIRYTPQDWIDAGILGKTSFRATHVILIKSWSRITTTRTWFIRNKKDITAIYLVKKRSVLYFYISLNTVGKRSRTVIWLGYYQYSHDGVIFRGK